MINGGAILHKTKWAKKATYKDIVMKYISCVRAKYGPNCCIVFDAYGNGPSTKEEHLRRSGKRCEDIKLSKSMEVPTNRLF